MAYNLTTTGRKGVLQVAYNLSTTGRQTRCSASGLVEKTQSDHHRQKRCSTGGLQSVHCRQTNKVFCKWPCRKNTIWPPQAEKVFYKWPCRKNTHNLTTTGRQTRCSTGGLQSVHHRQTECSTSGLHSVHHRQTNKVFYKWLQSVHRKQTNKVFYKWPTICPPQANKQGVLQVAYNLTTTGRQTRCCTSGLHSDHPGRQTRCSTSGLHSDHHKQTRQGVLTYRLALARGLVLGAIHPGDGHLLAYVGRSQLFPGGGQSLAVATPVHSGITQCCNTAATPVHSRITQCYSTVATPVHSRITQCYNTAATPVHSRITQCYSMVATPVHSRITQCYNTAATHVHSRIML